MKRLLLFTSVALTLTACATQTPTDRCRTKPIAPPAETQLKIVDKPIDFGLERVALTKAYIKSHYGKDVDTITITPRVIVLHYTAIGSLEDSFRALKPQTLRGRKDIAKASALNVSAHYLVDRDGTIYRLMPDNHMARHVIGLNYSAIGVENVAKNAEDLTPAQLKANIALVKYLKRKYPTIRYLIGHHEYRKMEKTPLWLEKDRGYRTKKYDPGAKFMREVRSGVRWLGLKEPPKQ